MFRARINLFDLIIRILLVLLPFSTLISVFSSQVLTEYLFSQMRILGFYKEILLISALLYILIAKIRGVIQLRWTIYDALILGYIGYMILISIFTTKIPGIIYGGRYDFSFLITFWIAYHGAVFLEKPISYYIKLILISSGSMLFLSGLLKYPLSEDLLLYAGYCGNPSAWHACNGVPPIFHGIEGANTRRFQGLLDNPNTMGAFLIFFSGLFAYYIREKKNWHFVAGTILLGTFIMTIYTYSRSALLGMIIGYILVVIVNMRHIFQKYFKEFIVVILLGAFFVGGIVIQFSGTLGAVIGREGSTKGHFERMTIGIERFISAPLGQGLASSGPAYRYVIDEKVDQLEKTDTYYIPESWYIQQLVEGGIIGFILFIGILFMIFLGLLRTHILLGAMFVGIGVMNFFLHTFESSVLVLPLFLTLGIILSRENYVKRHLKQ